MANTITLGTDVQTKQAVTLTTDARRNSIYIIGTAGTGKRNILEQIAWQDMQNGDGLCFIDTYGDSVEWLREVVPPDRKYQVIYWDPSDTEYPFGLNPFDTIPEYRNTTRWDSWSDERIGAECFVAALESLKEFREVFDQGFKMRELLLHIGLAFATNRKRKVIEIAKFLRPSDEHKLFRKQFYERLGRSHPQSLHYWQRFDNHPESERAQLVGLPLEKFARIADDEVLQSIFDQAHSSVDFRDHVYEDKILLVDLSGVSEDNATFIAAFIVWELWQTASNRPRAAQGNFHLIADEFQNYMSVMVPQILKQGANFHFDAVLAHQSRARLEEEIAESTLSVKNKVIFAVSEDDAADLWPEFGVAQLKGKTGRHQSATSVLYHLSTQGHPDTVVMQKYRRLREALDDMFNLAMRAPLNDDMFSYKLYHRLQEERSEHILAQGKAAQREIMDFIDTILSTSMSAANLDTVTKAVTSPSFDYPYGDSDNRELSFWSGLVQRWNYLYEQYLFEFERELGVVRNEVNFFRLFALIHQAVPEDVFMQEIKRIFSSSDAELGTRLMSQFPQSLKVTSSDVISSLSQNPLQYGIDWDGHRQTEAAWVFASMEATIWFAIRDLALELYHKRLQLPIPNEAVREYTGPEYPTSATGHKVVSELVNLPGYMAKCVVLQMVENELRPVTHTMTLPPLINTNAGQTAQRVQADWIWEYSRQIWGRFRSEMKPDSAQEPLLKPLSSSMAEVYDIRSVRPNRRLRNRKDSEIVTRAQIGIDSTTRLPVYISSKARQLSTYIIGAPGTGKSSLLEHLAYTDMLSGAGLCFIDPKGSSAEVLLHAVPEKRKEDVIFLDITDKEHPFGLNPFFCEDRDEASSRADEFVNFLQNLEEFRKPLEGASRALEILYNMAYIFCLSQHLTLAHAPKFLEKEKFRSKFYALLDESDTQARDFWNWYDARNKGVLQQSVEAALNKVRRFQRNRQLKRIFGQVRSTVNFSRAMQDGKIIIVKIPDRALGRDEAAFIAAYIISEIKRATFLRTPDSGLKTPLTTKPKQFHLIVDEFQRFMTTNFEDLHTEGRGFGVDVTVAHQNRNQITDDEVAGSTLAVGNKIVFRVSGKDAEKLSQEFKVETTEEKQQYAIPVHVLAHLEKYSHPDGLVRGLYSYIRRELDLSFDAIRSKINEQARLIVPSKLAWLKNRLETIKKQLDDYIDGILYHYMNDASYGVRLDLFDLREHESVEDFANHETFKKIYAYIISAETCYFMADITYLHDLNEEGPPLRSVEELEEMVRKGEEDAEGRYLTRKADDVIRGHIPFVALELFKRVHLLGHQLREKLDDTPHIKQVLTPAKTVHQAQGDLANDMSNLPNYTALCNITVANSMTVYKIETLPPIAESLPDEDIARGEQIRGASRERYNRHWQEVEDEIRQGFEGDKPSDNEDNASGSVQPKRGPTPPTPPPATPPEEQRDDYDDEGDIDSEE